MRLFKRDLPYRFQKGSWQPGRLRFIDHKIMIYLLLSTAYVRGVDYTTGDDTWGARDFMIQAAPEWVWGIVGFLFGAAILTWGCVSRRHTIVYIGHIWLGVTYLLNSAALGFSTFDDFPHFDGIRGGGVLLFPTLIHLTTALRTGVRPLRCSGHVEEEVVGS